MTTPLPHVRHLSTPPPGGCRWCGIPERDHAHRWVPSRRWHRWAQPTAAQCWARMVARRDARAALKPQPPKES